MGEEEEGQSGAGSEWMDGMKRRRARDRMGIAWGEEGTQ
jgi:hypothetical protein